MSNQLALQGRGGRADLIKWQAPDAKANSRPRHQAEPSPAAASAHEPKAASAKLQPRTQRPRRANGAANM